MGGTVNSMEELARITNERVKEWGEIGIPVLSNLQAPFFYEGDLKALNALGTSTKIGDASILIRLNRIENILNKILEIVSPDIQVQSNLLEESKTDEIYAEYERIQRMNFSNLFKGNPETLTEEQEERKEKAENL